MTNGLLFFLSVEHTFSIFRFLEIVIFEIERHWAYSMHLKIDMGDNVVDRQKFHMRQKLRRAAKCSNILLGLVKQCESVVY